MVVNKIKPLRESKARESNEMKKKSGGMNNILELNSDNQPKKLSLDFIYYYIFGVSKGKNRMAFSLSQTSGKVAKLRCCAMAD